MTICFLEVKSYRLRFFFIDGGTEVTILNMEEMGSSCGDYLDDFSGDKDATQLHA